MLEQRAENFGPDHGPVAFGGAAEAIELVRLQLDSRRLGKQAAVKVSDLSKSPALAALLIHGGKKAAEQVIAFRFGLAVLQQLRHKIFGQEVDVFGEEGDQHLQDESL